MSGIDSEIGELEIGEPQGSDLPSPVQRSTVSVYAFDISFRLNSRDISQLNKAINDDLEHLDSWLKGNKLSLKVAKIQIYVDRNQTEAPNAQQCCTKIASQDSWQ